MKFVFTSDLHGSVKGYRRFCEILGQKEIDAGILGGDLTGNKKDSLNNESEIKAMISIPGKEILFLMGNFDGLLGENWSDTELIKSIHMKSISLYGQEFAGYQYTNPFVGGSFEKPESEQLKDLENLEVIVGKSTIFISHGPAHGTLDKTRFGKKAGSRVLKMFIEKTKPRLHLFGHIHESAGMVQGSVNASYPVNRKFLIVDTQTGEADFTE